MGVFDELFDPDALRAPEVATKLGVSLWTARRLAREGVLAAQKEYSFGPVQFVDAGSLRAFERDRRCPIAKGFEPQLSRHHKWMLYRQKKREAEAAETDG